MKSRILSSGTISAALVLLAVNFEVRGDVRLPAIFSDHAVLQQKQPIQVWGWADPGESVTVEFRKQKMVTTTPPGGRWSVTLKAEKVGDPEVLRVVGKNTISLQDVVVGEVWVASGQSNMEFPLRASLESSADVAAATNADLRHFNVAKGRAEQPRNDVKGSWQVAGPTTVGGFSAVAYYFSRDLQKALHVPVGILHTSWGGSPAEVWMSQSVLAGSPEYQRSILEASTTSHARYLETVKQWEARKAQAAQEGRTFSETRPRQDWRPSELYNAMIAPLLLYTIKGAIWYQGESNAGHAWQYRRLYADLIRNWRQDWGLGDFTFLGVQLAPFDQTRRRTLEEITAVPTNSTWAELREAQVLSTQVLKNCGLAIITDLGEKDDIHPKKKAPVGARLALEARRLAYGENILSQGPMLNNMKLKDSSAVLTFDHVGTGLEARGGALTGFAIAGADRRFVWAQAEIQGEKVVVSHPQVAAPVAVRYGWSDFPVVNLFNKEGLPASPFRTDDFPMITAPKPAPGG